MILTQNSAKAVDLTTEMTEQAKENFGISEFVDETKKYTGEFLEGENISNMLSSAIAGKVDNSTFLKRILKVHKILRIPHLKFPLFLILLKQK